tara:strand:- start:14464 stop:14895 length:432 start_codon:yes stop_codon:yes gene_type:complete
VTEFTAMNFEAVKISLNQSGDGVVLKMAVHPDDCPPDLMTDWVGSRYMVAMVKIDEFEQPVSDHEEISRLKASCGALCRNLKFQTWVLRTWQTTKEKEVNEENATLAIKDYLGIKSRSEFNTNAVARSAFAELREEFHQCMKS